MIFSHLSNFTRKHELLIFTALVVTLTGILELLYRPQLLVFHLDMYVAIVWAFLYTLYVARPHSNRWLEMDAEFYNLLADTVATLPDGFRSAPHYDFRLTTLLAFVPTTKGQGLRIVRPINKYQHTDTLYAYVKNISVVNSNLFLELSVPIKRANSSDLYLPYLKTLRPATVGYPRVSIPTSSRHSNKSTLTISIYLGRFPNSCKGIQVVKSITTLQRLLVGMSTVITPL